MEILSIISKDHNLELNNAFGVVGLEGKKLIAQFTSPIHKDSIFEIFGNIAYRALEINSEEFTSKIQIIGWSLGVGDKVKTTSYTPGSSPSSWFSGRCSECGYEVVVTQSKKYDYFYYCSNKSCKNHTGHELFDQDDLPNWIS